MIFETPPIPPLFCPYPDCESSPAAPGRSPVPGRIVRKGFYYRREDARRIPRWRCRKCRRSFASSRLLPCYRQKKRRMNAHIDFLLSSGISQRRVARYLHINLKTVARKLVYCAEQARREREVDQERRIASGERYTALQFDELETFERSKCLPLSVPLVVVPKTRKIVGFRVASMPPKGPLVKISRKKYGWRVDHRPREVWALFQEIAPLTAPGVRILTDQNPKYPNWLKPHFAECIHETTKGRRGSTTGQGELKRVVFDPLFSLNHTCAMLRANINRLMRRTWCTTKRPDRLAAHLELYVRFHNTALTQKPGVFNSGFPL